VERLVPKDAPAELQLLVEAEVRLQLDARLAAVRSELEQAIAEVRERTVDNRAAIVIFSGDLDKVLAGLIIATGAAAAGMQTSLFFTFWGLSAMKKRGARARGRKSFKERLFALMTPSSSESLGVSQMNYFGIGARMLRGMMKEREVASPEELIGLARELGVRLVACTMSMEVMGLEQEQLLDGIEVGGVAAFLGEAASSRLQLFV
jgi:peroxiredoxin family protein